VSAASSGAKTAAGVAAATIAGALGAVAIVSPRQAWLAWVAVVPLLGALRHAGPRRTLGLAAAYTVVLGTGSVAPWITPAAVRYFDLSPWHAAAITVPSLAAVWTVHGVGLGALLLFRPLRAGPWAVVWYASAWACWEAIRTVVFPYYPAAVLGASQYEALPVVQIASVCGVAGITWAIVACNAGLAALLPSSVAHRDTSMQLGRRPGAEAAGHSGAPIIALATGLAIAATATAIGAVRLATAPAAPQSSGLSIGLVDVAASAPSAGSLYRYLSASLDPEGSPTPALVWPESALATDIERDRASWAELTRFVTTTGTTLIAGGPGSSLRSRGRLARFNSVHVLRPARGLRSYHKRLLVPFAERWPALLGPPPAGIGNLSAGRELTVFEVDGRAFGVLICFEVTDSRGARLLADRGAGFLVNPTNDVWFPSTAPHLPWAVIRAVESGLPVVRAANAGVSIVVDRYGHRLLESAADDQAALSVVTLPEGQPTLYARAGDVFVLACGAIVLAGAIVNRRTLAQRGRRSARAPAT
jgi:apolipoprotein N-acyltransferase